MAKAPSKVTSAQSASELLRVRGVLELLVAAAAFIAYAGTLAFGFVYDDRAQVLDNKIITDWSYVPSYFTHHIWALIDPQVAPNYYRPVFLLWLKINYSLFELSPAWWHFTSIALHIVATLQVFWLAKRLCSNRNLAAVAALLFAVHPVHVESVAWISGVTDPILCVNMLAAVLFYLRWREKDSVISYAASLVFATLAFLSKEPSVVLPLMMVITAWASRDRQEKSEPLHWKSLVPYFGLAIAYLAIRHHVISGFAHNMSNGTVRQMVLTWPVVIGFYLRQMFLPYELSLFHSVPWVNSPTSARFLLPLLAIVALCGALAVAMRFTRERHAMAAAIAWLALPLAPMMYLRVYMEGELVHDRYTYVSTVGLCLLLALVGRQLLELVPEASRAKHTRAVVAACAVVFLVPTFYNQADWASDLLLFTHALKVAPDSSVAKLDLGTIYAEKGDPESLAIGKKFFEEVTRQSPGNAAAWFDLGHAEYNQGDFAAAEKHTFRALEIDPNFAPWWMHFAGIELRLGKFNEAEGAALAAIRITPNEPGYHAALGAVYLGSQKFDLAERAFRAELKIHPDNETARKGLASIAAMQAGLSPSGSPPTR